MIRVVIICEGQTEVEFCKKTLAPHFLSLGIYIQHPLIKKTGGGIVPWNVLKKQVLEHLNENEVYVTTFIDFYGIKELHSFPQWNKAKSLPNKSERMDLLETSMCKDIEEKFQHRFMPYLQLHEFEGLLFNNIETFDDEFEEEEITDRAELEKVLRNFPNPELINDDPKTAPSKRLDNLIAGYDKIVYGNILAENIGLSRIRRKSPRFNEWITKLERLADGA